MADKQKVAPLNEPLAPNGAPAKKEEEGASAIYLLTVGVLSVLSSVFIAICMKKVMEGGFPFPLTVSWIAYVFTWLFYVVIKQAGVWKPEKDKEGNEKNMPAIENIKVAVASIGSISFMNLCLKVNTVAIYQICKFATIPTTLTLHYYVWNRKTNSRVIAALILNLSGVMWASMKSFDAGKMQFIGIIFAVVAVISTSVYRIFQETKQKEFGIGAEMFQASMSGWQAVLGLVACFIVEGLPIENPPSHTSIAWAQDPGRLARQAGTDFRITMCWMLGVCASALLVNWTSMVIIGKFGPVAYAVIGNAKTVLTIFLGIILFPRDENAASIRGDIIGCTVGIVGSLFYTYFEYYFKKGYADIVETSVPALVPKKIEDWKAEKAEEKRQQEEEANKAKLSNAA